MLQQYWPMKEYWTLTISSCRRVYPCSRAKANKYQLSTTGIRNRRWSLGSHIWGCICDTGIFRKPHDGICRLSSRNLESNEGQASRQSFRARFVTLHSTNIGGRTYLHFAFSVPNVEDQKSGGSSKASLELSETETRESEALANPAGPSEEGKAPHTDEIPEASRQTSTSSHRGSMKSALKGQSPRSASPSSSHVSRSLSGTQAGQISMDAALGAGKSIKQIVGAGFKSPMDFTLSVARGFHNAPKLYGDESVRQAHKVTGLQSGLKAAGKVSVLRPPYQPILMT